MWNVGATLPRFGGCTGNSREGCTAARALLGARRRLVVDASCGTGRSVGSRGWAGRLSFGPPMAADRSGGTVDLMATFCVLARRVGSACARVYDGLLCFPRVCPADVSTGSMCRHASNPWHRELSMVSGGRGLLGGIALVRSQAPQHDRNTRVFKGEDWASDSKEISDTVIRIVLYHYICIYQAVLSQLYTTIPLATQVPVYMMRRTLGMSKRE